MSKDERIKQLERALFVIMTNCDDSNFDVYAEAKKALEANGADT